MAGAGVPQRLGGGDLHRLVLPLHHAELAADEHIDGDGRQQDHQRDDGSAAERVDLVLPVEVPGGHREHDHGSGDERGQDDVGVAPQEDGIGEQRPDVVELGLVGAVVRGVTDRVLHPRVGRHDEGGGEHGPRGHEPDAGQVRLLREAVPPEDPEAQERRLQEEGGEALHGQRSAEDVAHEARVGGPVHAELELLNQPRHHAHGDVDQEQRPEEPGQAAIGVVAVAVPGGLQQGDQEGQPDGDRNEEEVVDAGAGELPACEVQAHGLSFPSLRTEASSRVVASPAAARASRAWAAGGSRTDPSFINSSHHRPA